MRAPTLLHRLGTGLFGLAFLFAIQATAAGWRQCPHHDQVAPGHAAPAGEHDGHAPDAPAAPEHEGPCSCLSGAQCAAPVALHAATTPLVVAAGPVTLQTAAALAHQAPARIPSHYLPDATAPPVVL